MELQLGETPVGGQNPLPQRRREEPWWGNNLLGEEKHNRSPIRSTATNARRSETHTRDTSIAKRKHGSQHTGGQQRQENPCDNQPTRRAAKRSKGIRSIFERLDRGHAQDRLGEDMQVTLNVRRRSLNRVFINSNN